MEFTSLHGNVIHPQRRKLVLRERNHEPDLTKALVLYKPPGKIKFLGRNLIAPKNSMKEKKQTSRTENSPKTNPKSISTTFVNLTIWTLGILCTLFLFTIFQSQLWTHYSCDPTSFEVSFETAKNNLKRKLYGQTTAINEIAAAMNELTVTVKNLAVLLLLGPSGTGKTFTMNVISQSLPPTVKQIKLHLPLLSIEEVKVTLNSIECCKWNFIFIEDSDYTDLNKIEATVRALQAIHLNITCHKVKIVVMLTSSCSWEEFLQASNEKFMANPKPMEGHQPLQHSKYFMWANNLGSSLATALKSIGLDFTNVPYFPLGEEEIKSCIIADLKAKKKRITRELIDEIMTNIPFQPIGSQQFSISGCKPVSTQVNLKV